MIIRRLELDALRGLLLLTMALTHLPTRMSAYASQPFGFVSAAEGFVFLSAFLAGVSFRTTSLERGAQYARSRLWTRALRLYGYHLLLLLFAFTIAAAFAALTGRPALRNLLTFYFDSPVIAIISGPLLLYQPPLFDILPMYIVFLLATPLLYAAGVRFGWRNVLVVSVLVWLFAQLDGRRWVYDTIPALAGVRFPMEAAGSFNWFAWQLLWVVGAWAGVHRAVTHVRLPMRVIVAAAAIAVAFLLWRHGFGGLAVYTDRWAGALDKWDLGVLRLVNFAALAVVVARLVLPLLAWVHFGVLAVLGRASLQVFCAHLLVCVASLGLIVDDATPLTTVQEGIVVALTVAVMFAVARRAARKAQARRAPRPAKELREPR